MANFHYYTTMQSLVQAQDRISIDEFIWNAIERCSADLEDLHPLQMSYYDGCIERGQSYQCNVRSACDQLCAIKTIMPKQSSIYPPPLVSAEGPSPSAGFIISPFLISMTLMDGDMIECHSYVLISPDGQTQDYPEGGRFMYFYDVSPDGYRPFAENREHILEMIPHEIIQSGGPRFKAKEDLRNKSFALFPCNFPHQSPIILPRKWVRKYCCDNILVSRDGRRIDNIELPADMIAIPDVVCALIEKITSDPSNNLLAMVAAAALSQDEIDVMMKIFHHLGVEIVM